jgi:hypothetical protein
MTQKIIKTHGGLKMAPFEPVDATALQQMWNGTADADMQQKALVWILEGACGIHDVSFVPGADGQRMTDFNEGRRFVAKQIAEILRTNITVLLEELRRKDG